MTQDVSVTLSQLTARVGQAISYSPGLQNVWVTAETADVRVSGGHCYMELVEKDPATGRPLAKMRAAIWANNYYRLAPRFQAATGQVFRSDINVMVLGNVTFHPVFGLSIIINDINPEYTAGDMLRRRMMMIQRLRQEGIIDMNRTLEWTLVPQRIAVISAAGAAGYGDFIDQLYTNNSHIRFTTRLFPAVLQGDRTAPSIIEALNAIADNADDWDCVVIIRGGGATTDLLAFDNYDLAANIAQFPLPVIIGIGHERDRTLLDEVANMRVKTPTAAAEWLVQRGEAMLGYLQGMASSMLQAVTDRINGCHRQLSYIAGQLPAAAGTVVIRARQRLTDAHAVLAGVGDRRLRPEMARLDGVERALCDSVSFALQKARQSLDAKSQMLDVLSPQATLRRGYSITRVGGHAVTDPAQVPAGATVETLLAAGMLRSVAADVSADGDGCQ